MNLSRLFPVNLLAASVWHRLALAAVAAVLLWLAVGWALESA